MEFAERWKTMGIENMHLIRRWLGQLVKTDIGFNFGGTASILAKRTHFGE
ncbi:MAG: hypothetical protein SWH68_03945 [Thermodesulfobacteriota bacterium]|nr:hypothetical protein [Thermodesulfobacteriota bacterium]